MAVTSLEFLSSDVDVAEGLFSFRCDRASLLTFGCRIAPFEICLLPFRDL
jgi:hypothetical protein